MSIQTVLFVLMLTILPNCFSQKEVNPLVTILSIDSNYVIMDSSPLEIQTTSLQINSDSIFWKWDLEPLSVMPIEHRIYFRILNEEGKELFSEQETNLTDPQKSGNNSQVGNYLLFELDDAKLGFTIATVDTFTHRFKYSNEYLWLPSHVRIQNLTDKSNVINLKYFPIKNETNINESTFGIGMVDIESSDTMKIYGYCSDIYDYFLDIKFQKGTFLFSVPKGIYSSDKFRFMKISESEIVHIITPRNYKKFELKKYSKKQMNSLFKSY
ncbi:MAG: hypothetical protein K9I37_02835 [Crocinitomicaceae bacterium]|nr:hypothetical protein [Crocinitomicaceae bacterium]